MSQSTVSGMRRLNAFLPVLIWMAIIFTASTDLGSVRRTSRFIGPLLRWFHPTVSEETIHTVQVVVRKGGHLTGYACLALWFWRARQVMRAKRFFEDWSWRAAGWIVLWCGLYAVSDEFHQSFVASRQGQLLDVAIDTAGAFVGLLVVWAIVRWRGRAV